MRLKSLAIPLAAIGALLQSAPVSAETAARPWTVGTPIVTYVNWNSPSGYDRSYGWPAGYDPTTLTENAAQQAVAGGFNLVWINDLSQLPIAERYGLRAQLVISGHQPQNDLFFRPATNWPAPASLAAVNALIDGFKASPAAYSYYIVDEPNVSYFPQLATIVAYLRQRDPAHLAYINLFSPDERPQDLGVADYATYLAQFIAKVHPALLSFDSYNLWVGRDRRFILGNLQMFAQAAAQAGIPFMTIVQGCACGAPLRLPKPAELNFLVNASVAFGAQGISYWNYWTGTGPSAGGVAPFPDGRPSATFPTFQAINPVYQTLATRLQGLKWLGTYLKGYGATSLPPNVKPLPRNAAFDIPELENTLTYADGAPLTGVLLGYFGAANNPTYVFVQNLDYSAGHTYRVTGPGALAVLNSKTNVWSTGSGNSIAVSLEPGGGALLALASAAVR